MPKYVLDEKGILTITSEHDGGIFSFNDALKKLTVVLFVISILISLGVYVFFYSDSPTTNVANTYCLSSVARYNYLLPMTRILEKCGWKDVFKTIVCKLEESAEYYLESLEKIIGRGYDFALEIYNQVELFKHKWR